MPRLWRSSQLGPVLLPGDIWLWLEKLFIVMTEQEVLLALPRQRSGTLLTHLRCMGQTCITKCDLAQISVLLRLRNPDAEQKEKGISMYLWKPWYSIWTTHITSFTFSFKFSSPKDFSVAWCVWHVFNSFYKPHWGTHEACGKWLLLGLILRRVCVCVCVCVFAVRTVLWGKLGGIQAAGYF